MNFIPDLIRNNSNYRLLFLTGILSRLGGFITDTAVSLHLYKLTDKNAFYLGVARAANVFSFFVGSILGGALGVKYPKNKILIFCEFARMPLTFALLFLDSANLIIAATAMIGFFTGIFSPSKVSLSNDVVLTSEIEKAQSINSTAMAFIHLVAPVAAALLYENFGFEKILYLDLLSYAAGVFLLLRVSLPPRNEEELKEAANSSISLINEGIKFTFGDKVTSAIFYNGVVSGFIVGFLISLLLPYVDSLYSNAESTYGVLLSLFGLGGLLGGALFLKLNKKFNVGKIIFTTHVLESVMLLLWLQVTNLYIASSLFFVWGIFVFTRMTAQFSFISKNRPKEMHTRLFSSIELSFMLPNVIGSLLAGIMVKSYSPRELLIGSGILFILFTIMRIPLKGTRELYKA